MGPNQNDDNNTAATDDDNNRKKKRAAAGGAGPIMINLLSSRRSVESDVSFLFRAPRRPPRSFRPSSSPREDDYVNGLSRIGSCMAVRPP